MWEFLLFAFGTIGMSHIIVDSSLMEPIRNWYERKMPERLASLVNCYLCSGFWAGIICGFFVLSSNLLMLFVCGCAGAFLSNLAAVMLNYLEARSIVDIGDEDGDKEI